MIVLANKLRAADFYCGGGGFTTGAEQSDNVDVVYVLNHWDTAIETHKGNYPDKKHRCADLNRVARKDDIRNYRLRGIDMFLASPECTFHSVARGGAPINDQRRVGPWELYDWIRACKPEWLAIENVCEFRNWCRLRVKRHKNGKPVLVKKGKDKGLPHMEPDPKFKGEYFWEWWAHLELLGYELEIHILNSADFEDCWTKRKRLFVIGRLGKKPNLSIVPTHAKNPKPGSGLKPWRPAHEIIDWQRPAASIFPHGRPKPLADNSLRRIEVGLRKFVQPAIPYLLKYQGTATVSDVREPLDTITGGGKHFALVIPYGVTYHNGKDGHNRQFSLLDPLPVQDTSNRNYFTFPFIFPHFNERDGQSPRTHDVNDPLPAVTSRGAGNLAFPFMLDLSHSQDKDRTHSLGAPLPAITSCHSQALAIPFIFDCNHGHDDKSGGRAYSIGEPFNAFTTKRGHSLALPFFTKYYGTGGAVPVDEPLDTITTKERFGIATAYFGYLRASIPKHWMTPAMVSLLSTMEELGVGDIFYRMVDNDELSLATGFPRNYYWHGTKGDITKQIGNAVPPGLAKAICRAIGEVS